MKSTLTLFILLLFLLINIVGCEDEPVIPEPIFVSGDAYASPASIIAGEATTIFLKDLVNVASATIDENPISIVDKSKTFTPTTTTSFVVKFIGKDNVTYQTKTVVVIVAPAPIPTKRDTIINLLCYGSFKKVKLETKINDVWDGLTMPEKETRRLLIFTKDGKYKDYDPLGVDITFTGDYKISVDLAYLIYMSQENEIITLNDKQLILIYWAQTLDLITNQWVQKGSQIRETYDRVK